MPDRGLQRVVLFAIALVALIAPGLARAEVRTVTITDPQDAPAAAAGAAKDPDLKSVDVSYDNVAGTVLAVVKFYESVAARKAETNITVHLGAAPGKGYECVPGPKASQITAVLFVKQGVGLLTLAGWENVILSPSAVLSADGLTFTVRFTNRTALGGFDYRCADVGSVWTSRYKDPVCNYYECETIETDLDRVFKNAWFPGFAPVPAPPTNLAVTSATASTLALQWQEDDKSVTGFEVIRDGQVIGTTETTSYTVAGLTCGRSYTLSVRANTPYTHSTEVSVTGTTAVCAPKTPARVSVVRATRTSVTVAWGATANATDYVVWVGSRSAHTSGARATVTGLRCGKRYSVTVRATGPGGKSAVVRAVARTKPC